MKALHWPETWGPRVCDELEIVARCGPLDRVQVLEVGCGKARTRAVAAPLGRGEALPFAGEAFDQVWLLKSLHHIPDPDAALAAQGPWAQQQRWPFVQPVHFTDAQDFERRMMGDALVRTLFDPCWRGFS